MWTMLLKFGIMLRLRKENHVSGKLTFKTFFWKARNKDAKPHAVTSMCDFNLCLLLRRGRGDI